ncbi:zinc-dependent alcohol dehydrogenase family protein [Actinomycetota bacterium Odt1-20B]
MTTDRLRAIVRTFGPAADVVTTERYAPERPGPGQVAVRMLLAGVNPSDLVTISGAYASRTTLPFVPGFEGVGVVEETGPGVAEVTAGQRVLPLGSAGAWQEVKVTESRWCFPVRAGLDDTQAATAYINPLTAHLMIRQKVRPAPGAVVAVNAAASAIGRTLLRLLTRAGARPVAVVRHPRSLPQLDGVVDPSAIVCTADGPAGAALRDLTAGRGADAVLDAVGGPDGADLCRALRPGGTLVHYGLLSGRPLPHDLWTERPDVRVVLFRLRDWVHTADRGRVAAALDKVYDLVLDGTAATPVAGTYPLSVVREALLADGAAGRTGKVLIDCRR